MPNTLFRIMDAGHGMLIVILLYFACRLLVVHKEGLLRVRTIAAAMLLITLIQTISFLLINSTDKTHIKIEETFTIWMDLLSFVGVVFMIWLFYRNRHIFQKREILLCCGLLITLLASYLLCLAFKFADWTYVFYLPFTTIVWTYFAYTIEHLQLKEATKITIDDAFITELEQVLREERRFCRNDLTRDEICRMMCTNRTTLSKRLLATTGKTLREYLHDIRLKEAALLLKATNMPIEQIALEVGLQSTSGFYRNFLFSYGMTPKEFINQTN